MVKSEEFIKVFHLSEVLRNKGVYENVKFVQQENFWVGPSSVSILCDCDYSNYSKLYAEDCNLIVKVTPEPGYYR